MKKTLSFIPLGKLIIGSLGCAFGLIVQAAQTGVTVENFDFNPSSVSINVNDSVKWTWSSGTHTTTSSSGLWDSGPRSSGSFTNTFTSAGNFPYFCSIHTFMTASVTVTGPNQPPSVSITNPPNNATFSAPWTGVLQATASDDGSVTNVEFFSGSASLGSVSSAPYNLAVNNLASGAYTFTAVATDNLGATNTSAGVSITVVTPVAIVLSDLQRLSDSEFRLSYTANAGLRYVVERSAGLSDFSGINTNTAASGSVTFTDGDASGGLNFYRVRQLPNP
jgi:plastocyanin